MARCRAAVDPDSPDDTIREVKEPTDTVTPAEAEVLEAQRLADEQAEEPEIYELAPEIEPIRSDAAEVADPVWNESTVMTWEEPVPVRRGLSVSMLVGLGTFVILGLVVLTWSLFG